MIETVLSSSNFADSLTSLHSLLTVMEELLNKYPPNQKRFSYGTAGFRDKFGILHSTFLKMGIMVTTKLPYILILQIKSKLLNRLFLLRHALGANLWEVAA